MTGNKKGTGTFCAKHAAGRYGKMYLSPSLLPLLLGHHQSSITEQHHKLRTGNELSPILHLCV